MKSDTDVLVVGAGPVGLMLAVELQRRRVDHLLIERKSEPSYFVKALGVSPRTLERFPILTDAEGTFRATYGINAPSLHVIRPDGYIADRATPPNPDRLREYLRRILVPSPPSIDARRRG